MLSILMKDVENSVQNSAGTWYFQVIDETLSPTWDELLIFEEVLVYGRREDIAANPPMVIIEIYDQDKVSVD